MQFPKILKRIAKSQNIWKKNRLILREVRYFKPTVGKAIAFTLIGALLEGFTIGLIASFLQVITKPDSPPIQIGIEWINTWILASEASPTARVIRLAVLLCLMVWARSVFVYLGLLYSRTCEFKLIDLIRKRIFEQLQNLSIGYYSTAKTGNLTDMITNQLNQLRLAVTDVSNLLVRGSTLLAYIFAMILISWQLAIIAILFYSLLSLEVSWMVRKTREASFAVPRNESNLSSSAIEIINGIRTIKGSATESFERKRFYNVSEKVVRAGIKLATLRERTKPVSEALATTILILLVVISFVALIDRGNLEASELLTFMFVLFRMMPLVSQVNNMITRLAGYQGFIDSLQDFIRTSDKPYIPDGNTLFNGLKKHITFANVSFGYGKDEKALKNISIQFNRGETTALVGESGAGKSTLVDLIPRFYDPINGDIFFDSLNLRNIKVDSLRIRMSLVSQDTFIFNRSVRENIAYGIEDIEDEQVYEAAKLANALEFILELPKGFDTVLGERGTRLSGGQRQRIAIARAVLRNPEILILDEATSALDSITEKFIQDSLEHLSKGRTVIAIAHRLSTIKNADKIIVLEKGEIVEQGTYDELISQKAALWRYHKAQYGLTKETVAN